MSGLVVDVVEAYFSGAFGSFGIAGSFDFNAWRTASTANTTRKPWFVYLYFGRVNGARASAIRMAQLADRLHLTLEPRQSIGPSQHVRWQHL